MKFKKLYSSSAGNAFVLTSSIGKKILIECGGRWNDLQKELNFSLDFSSCFSTHSHIDHSANILKLLNYGIPCYMTSQTAFKHKVETHYNTHILNDNAQFNVDGFTIMSLPLSHLNVDLTPCECYAFYIREDNTGETMLFATDFHFIPWKFPKGLKIIAIECDFIEAMETSMPESVEKRRDISHYSLERLLECFKSNREEIKNVKEFYILHLSKNRANEDVIKKELERELGKEVLI